MLNLISMCTLLEILLLNSIFSVIKRVENGVARFMACEHAETLRFHQRLGKTVDDVTLIV